MEKFWTLTRLNRNGNGSPVWAGKNGGVRYTSEAIAIERASVYAAERGERIIISESQAFIGEVLIYPPPVPVRGFQLVSID